MRAKTGAFARSRARGPILILRMSFGWLLQTEQPFARSSCWRCVTRWTGSPSAWGPTMCKDYYAACVKIILPGYHRPAAHCCDAVRNLPLCSVDLAIDHQHIEAYLSLRLIRAAHGQ